MYKEKSPQASRLNTFRLSLYNDLRELPSLQTKLFLQNYIMMFLSYDAVRCFWAFSILSIYCIFLHISLEYSSQTNQKY